MINSLNRAKLIYNEYLKLLESNEKPLIGIELIAEKYNVNSSKIIKILQDYINQNIEKPEFAIIFDELRNSQNRNEYLDNTGISLEYLKNNLNKYLLLYRPEIGLKYNRYSKVFENIIKNYEAYLRNKEKTVPFNEARLLVLDFLNSEYSLERFCIRKGINVKSFNSKIEIIKKDTELYKNFLKNIELKEKLKYEYIEDDINTILKYIYELGNNFCIIDLFQITKFGPQELLSFAEQCLHGEQLKLFRKYIGIAYRNFAVYGNFMNNVRTEVLITTRYLLTINGEQIETTEEFRREVINFLREKEIPINIEIFCIACVRHYKGNLINKNYVR